MTEHLNKGIGALVSRRQGLGWLLATFSSGAGWTAGQTPVSAKRKKRKRKNKGNDNRPPVSLPIPSLEECRSRCGEACDCTFSPQGEILCGATDTRGRCQECRSGNDCPFGSCLAGFYAAGESTPSRFDCQYPAGVCADLLECAG